jgi:hypothetical protein
MCSEEDRICREEERIWRGDNMKRREDGEEII